MACPLSAVTRRIDSASPYRGRQVVMEMRYGKFRGIPPRHRRSRGAVKGKGTPACRVEFSTLVGRRQKNQPPENPFVLSLATSMFGSYLGQRPNQGKPGQNEVLRQNVTDDNSVRSNLDKLPWWLWWWFCSRNITTASRSPQRPGLRGKLSARPVACVLR